MGISRTLTAISLKRRPVSEASGFVLDTSGALDVRSLVQAQETLAELFERCASIDELARECSCPILITVSPNTPALGDLWSFNTATTRVESSTEPRPQHAAARPFFRLEKSDANPWAHVSLGRASNNDIVLRDPSVSKLHARFSCEGDAWAVTDAGSRNGTAIDDIRLTIGKPMTLADGMEIQIGRLKMVFLSQDALLELFEDAGANRQAESTAELPR